MRDVMEHIADLAEDTFVPETQLPLSCVLKSSKPLPKEAKGRPGFFYYYMEVSQTSTQTHTPRMESTRVRVPKELRLHSKSPQLNSRDNPLKWWAEIEGLSLYWPQWQSASLPVLLHVNRIGPRGAYFSPNL